MQAANSSISITEQRKQKEKLLNYLRTSLSSAYTTLEKLLSHPLNPELKTHKLHGKLLGLWACEVE